MAVPTRGGVGLGGGPEPSTPVTLAAAADNALRTALAMMALDDKRHEGHSRITTGTVAGTAVATLDPPIPFAYAVDRAHNRLILGASAGAVAHYLENAARPTAGERLHKIQAAARTNADTLAFIDLDAINHLAAKHLASLLQHLAARQGRSVDDVDRDLAHVLALARLFRALSSRAGLTTMRRPCIEASG